MFQAVVSVPLSGRLRKYYRQIGSRANRPNRPLSEPLFSEDLLPNSPLDQPQEIPNAPDVGPAPGCLLPPSGALSQGTIWNYLLHTANSLPRSQQLASFNLNHRHGPFASAQ